MSLTGIWLVSAAILDPEPTSKLGLMVGGGIVLVATGGTASIGILLYLKPPKYQIDFAGYRNFMDVTVRRQIHFSARSE